MKNTQILAIVKIIQKDAMRDKSIYTLLFSGVFMLALSMILGKMAVYGGQRIIQNMGFWIIGLWGLFCIMYFGAKNYKTDFDNKVIYMILSRPVSRGTYLTGKLLGIISVLSVLFLILSFVWILLLQSWHVTFSAKHAVALVFIFQEWILFAAVSLMICTFSTSFTHHFMIFGLYIMGHLSSDIIRYARVTDVEWLKPIFTFFYYALPNLEALNFRKNALYDTPILISDLMTGGVIFFSWTITMYLAAYTLWYRKKIK